MLSGTRRRIIAGLISSFIAGGAAVAARRQLARRAHRTPASPQWHDEFYTSSGSRLLDKLIDGPLAIRYLPKACYGVVYEWINFTVDPRFPRLASWLINGMRLIASVETINVHEAGSTYDAYLARPDRHLG